MAGATMQSERMHDHGASRPRSDGPLTQDERRQMMARNTGLAFDPVQIGSVPQDVFDDLAPAGEGPKAGWPSVRDAAESLTLRGWALSDAPEFRRLLDDPSVWAHMPTAKPEPLDRSVAETLITLSNDAAHHVVRAICVRGRPVGQVRLERLSDGSVEVSYWIGRAHWGGGIATRALRKLLDEHDGSETRLIARIHRDNPASARVVGKLGFVFESHDPAKPDWMIFARNAA
ncbi:GNAT family N-acetyltransferase [Cognatishimia sp. F0-27]|uniref:GNAT family N-acetyltransferase n=1 Tax=Cognatishimia sp. F0-27 TaxID=2816855 RepID=UPI001D0C07AB|nr:GNAT family N-acetyltransferase [Cognatishimia sp. F0-27]MCC1491201.1 GNAT family N-acetyltransferase [Cognatishimia sp. F0-27]